MVARKTDPHNAGGFSRLGLMVWRTSKILMRGTTTWILEV
jgi:hypothetical protein